MIAALHPPHRFADLIRMEPAAMVPEIYAMFAAYLNLDAQLAGRTAKGGG